MIRRYHFNVVGIAGLAILDTHDAETLRVESDCHCPGCNHHIRKCLELLGRDGVPVLGCTVCGKVYELHPAPTLTHDLDIDEGGAACSRDYNRDAMDRGSP